MDRRKYIKSTALLFSNQRMSVYFFSLLENMHGDPEFFWRYLWSHFVLKRESQPDTNSWDITSSTSHLRLSKTLATAVV